MKKCTSCGSLFPDEGRFCPECGGADAVLIPDEPAAPAAPAQQPEPVQGAYQPPVQPEAAPQGFNQPDPAQQGYYQPPYQPDPAQQSAYQAPAQGGYQAPAGEYVPPQGAYQPGPAAPYAAPPAQPKKKKTGCLIAVIIVGVLFLVVVIAIVIGAKKVAKEMQEELDPNSIIDEFLDELAPDSDTDVTVEYTKGELSGNVYTNEWAGLQFEIPEGLTDGSTADYDKYTDEHTDACLVTDDESKEGQVLLLIEDVSRVNVHYPPDDYLDIITENWLEEGDEEQGWAKTDPYSKTIAGEGYRLVALTNENADFTQLAACRCVDGKMICLLVWGTGSGVEDFLNSITAVSAGSSTKGTAAEDTDSVPAEYKSALKKAESYSTMMHMSKQGIYDQLTSEYGEQFPAEAAQYAIDHLDADYKQNALEKAKSYQENMDMSKAAIYDQLISEYGEKFTEEEAQYAIDHLD